MPDLINENLRIYEVIDKHEQIVIISNTLQKNGLFIKPIDKKHNVLTQNEVEAKIIYNMYLLYEFSDKVIILSDNIQFGGIINLISTGLLSLEEVENAILNGL